MRSSKTWDTALPSKPFSLQRHRALCCRAELPGGNRTEIRLHVVWSQPPGSWKQYRTEESSVYLLFKWKALWNTTAEGIFPQLLGVFCHQVAIQPQPAPPAPVLFPSSSNKQINKQTNKIQFQWHPQTLYCQTYCPPLHLSVFLTFKIPSASFPHRPVSAQRAAVLTTPRNVWRSPSAPMASFVLLCAELCPSNEVGLGLNATSWMNSVDSKRFRSFSFRLHRRCW